jgi:tRNA wybutosine-synthesizing protein 1
MARKNPGRKYCSISVRDKLKKMNYGLVGETSAVQICRWTKNSIRGNRGCWKEKFYGVSSAGCCQMTPSVMWCENQCLHCWRPIEMNLGTELPSVEDPIEILDGIIEARKKLLCGFKGNKNIDIKKFEEGLVPSLYTMSLSGEATLYPRLGEMFAEIRRRGAVSFLVTNGLNSEALLNLEKNGGELPTQLVVSTNAPNEKLFLEWHRSNKKNAWNEFLKTLEIVRKLKGKVRRVIRLTVVKPGMNGEFSKMTNMTEENVLEYCKLIRLAEPDFVHIKGFKAVGYAKERMGYDKQVWHDDVLEYAKKILEKLDGYSLKAEDERSCVVMLGRDGVEMKIERV